MRGWRESFKALMLVAATAAIMLLVSRGISVLPWLGIYQNQFAFTPGDWFAWRLNDAQRAPEKTCILVGASSMREGLSSSILERELPGITVVNMATTGSYSAIDAIEVQARILASKGNRYGCVLVGLHPMFLRKFDQNAYELVTTDYLAALSFTDLFDLGRRPWELPHATQIAQKYLMPLGQQSLQLNRLVRLSLYNAHREVIDQKRPSRDFELFEGEFAPQSQSIYAGHPDVLKDIEQSYTETIKEIGWDRAEMFGGPAEASVLHHSLSLLSSITDRLVVVELPESHLFRNVEKVARAPFEAALASANVSMEVIRCKIPSDEELEHFHDAVHLNQNGMDRVSRSVSRILRMRRADDVCEVRVN